MTKRKAAPKAEAKGKAEAKISKTTPATRSALAHFLTGVGVAPTKAYEALDHAAAQGVFFSHSGEVTNGPGGVMVLSGETEKQWLRQHGQPVEEEAAVPADSEEGIDIAAGADAPVNPDGDDGSTPTEDGDATDDGDVTDAPENASGDAEDAPVPGADDAPGDEEPQG